MVRCTIAVLESFLPKPCQETCPVGLGMNNRPLVVATNLSLPQAQVHAGSGGHRFSFFSKVGAASVELDRLTTGGAGSAWVIHPSFNQRETKQ
jgi:hypothetical protein